VSDPKDSKGFRTLGAFARLLAAVVAGAASGAAHAAEARIRVVTLHTVLTEIAREVGGDRVDIDPVVQPGVDPHAFQPSPGAVARMTQADLVLAGGLNLEPYLDRMVRNAGVRGRVLEVGDLVPVILQIAASGSPRSGAEKDPHWWHSIGDMLAATDLIRDAYARLRPQDAQGFADRARAYGERLRALQAWTLAEVARLPPGSRNLVTSHDAFGYFARDYGFTVYPINGSSPEGEPNAREYARIIDIIRSRRIRAIFPESTANARTVEGLVDDTGARIGPPLYADGLGPLTGDASTYDAMFRHNVTAIVSSLLGP
jgi:zinc/manganese transport system substrate-binding protein